MLLNKLRAGKLAAADQDDAVFVVEKMMAQIARLKASLKTKNQFIASRLKTS